MLCQNGNGFGRRRKSDFFDFRTCVYIICRSSDVSLNDVYIFNR